jgi:hypothetical protein
MQFCCMQCMFCLVRLYNRIFYEKLPSKKKISASHLPWMWIGVETESGKIITLTEMLESSIEYGDCITPKFLKAFTGIQDAKRWIYLDSKTFKEEEIPTVGLIIEDDSHE